MSGVHHDMSGEDEKQHAAYPARSMLDALAKGPLGGIVAEANAAIVEKAAKGGVALQHIIDCFGELPRLTIST